MSIFAYGDSTTTGDDKYVIAQFRADASMSWVFDLRSHLNLPELKFKLFCPSMFAVQSRTELWKSVLEGVYQAELTITDPGPYKRAVIITLMDDQAQPGIDFDERTINTEAAQWMIQGSPLGLADAVASDWLSETSEYVSFSSAAIHERAGGKHQGCRYRFGSLTCDAQSV